MKSLSRTFPKVSGLVVPLGLLVAAVVVVAPACAQEKAEKGKAAGVFDDDAKKPADAKAQSTPKAGGITDRDSIGFTQDNVSAQMTELEERMFRLSEALRSLEPENASRLRLALKFSREELILQQMKETQKLLKDAQLSKAETEVKELLAKLEHLRSVLLAEDLDFQMKLARLRQMRETQAQLERIIKEERRELAWSRTAVEQQKELQRVHARRAELEALVKDQKEVITETRDAGKKDDGAARKQAQAPSRERESGIRKSAAGLAADATFATLQPAYLKESDAHLGDALTLLQTADNSGAVASEEQALNLFQKELDRLNERTAPSEQAVAAAEFQRFERDQAKNRTATETLGEVSARLGDTGVALQKDMIRAGSAMRTAEGDLAKTAAKPAADDQVEALKHLAKSRDELAKATESLLVELRSELQARIIAELTEMHEIQMSIRETTEAQAPRVAQKSRTALLMVAGLSQKEGVIAERTDHLLALVEETEFGIALPTSLRVLSREMKTIQQWLKDGDTSPRTIILEKRVEEDLLGLLQAMRRLPPTTPPPPGSKLPSDLRARERELNRLIAELKMIRLLQARTNDDTLDVDKTRAGTLPLTPALRREIEARTMTPELRREIEALKASQDEIKSSLSKISARLESGQDSDPPPNPNAVDM
jgi:hypothetical protein